jgi:hypothetical protein
MGFFSWRTLDTDRSIPNAYSDRKTFTVYLKDHEGNVWQEDNYEGYGVFGGKDYYVLLAEMCGHRGEEEKLRNIGITIYFEIEKLPGLIFPNLVEDPDWEWVNKKNMPCAHQGYFY